MSYAYVGETFKVSPTSFIVGYFVWKNVPRFEKQLIDGVILNHPVNIARLTGILHGNITLSSTQSSLLILQKRG